MTTKRVSWIILCAGMLLSACKPEAPAPQPKAAPAVQTPAVQTPAVQTVEEDITLEEKPAQPDDAAAKPTSIQEPNPSVALAEEKGLGAFSVNRESVLPGSEITKKGAPLKLVGTPLQVGTALPTLKLTDASSGQMVLTSALTGKVLIISVVPAVTTPVCAMQSKYLESGGEELGKNITLLTVSRDSIEALDTFATSIGTRHAMYLSDREFGGFGEATGLKVEGADILARSVIVVDGTGIVRYMQVVPELTELPDMDKAFATARKLANESI